MPWIIAANPVGKSPVKYVGPPYVAGWTERVSDALRFPSRADAEKAWAGKLSQMRSTCEWDVEFLEVKR